MDSWKKVLPDYEFKKWDMEAVGRIDSAFMSEALECKKWAYAADYVRLYAIYNEGGIYLDTDVEVYSSFDPFLEHRLFIGRENSQTLDAYGRTQNGLSSHCFGAEAKHPFIEDCLSYYDSHHFIVSRNERLPQSLRWSMILIPYIQAEIARNYGYEGNVDSVYKNKKQECNDGICIYPSTYFDALSNSKGAVCRHLALGAWRDNYTAVDTDTIVFHIKAGILNVINGFFGIFNYKIVKKT